MLRRCIRQCSPGSTSEAATAAKLPAGNPVHKSWFRHNLIIRRKNNYRSRWGSGQEGYSTGVNFSDQVKLHCVDNTNCKHVRLIGKACGERLAHCRIFPAVSHRVSVMRFKSGRGSAGRQTVKPGTIYWVCLLSRRQHFSRMSGLVTSFDRSTCILLNDQRVPIGSRIMYVAGRHVNHKFHLKAAVLANYFV